MSQRPQTTPGTIRSLAAPDGRTLNYRHWEPEDPCRAVVLVVHGIQSHSGWYLRSCTALARAGYAVGALDRRGSGLNRTERGHLRRWTVLMEDLDKAVDVYRARYGQDIPIHLVGISWGAKQAAAYALERPEALTSVVFSGPGFFPKVDFAWPQKLRVAAGAFLRPHALLPIPIGRGEMFTDNPYWRTFVDSDPLTLRQATCRFFLESRRLDWYLTANLTKLTVPSLLAAGTADRIVDVEATQTFFSKLSTPECRIIKYEGWAHTLEFHEDPARYIGDLLSWLGAFDPTTHASGEIE